MTEDPHGRPPWTPPSWPSGPPPGYGPPAGAPPGYGPPAGAPPGYGPPPPPSFGPGDPAQQHGYPPGGPETLAHPAPPGGFSWRDRGDVPPPRPPGRPIGRILLAVGGVLALLAAAAAAYLLLPRPTPAPPPAAPATPAAPPAPAPTPPAPTPEAAPGPVKLTATAACVSPPSRDGAGAVVAYGPEQMVDGRTDTAWRCDGDGAGETVRVTFDRPVRVQQVGIIPGYAKTDPADGTDRYAQNRRIAQVRYRFDDGTTVDQTLETGTADRSLQTVAVPGVTSSGMTISIVRSVPGTAVGPAKASDRIAVSELEVLGG